MRLLHTAGAVAVAFDDPNLVSRAGLEPVMRLAGDANLHGLVAEKVHVPTDKGANAAGKVATIVAGMVAGADSIDNIVRDAGLAAVRLRGGKAGSARGAASMVAETIATAKACGATGLIIVRADSAFYAAKVIRACHQQSTSIHNGRHDHTSQHYKQNITT